MASTFIGTPYYMAPEIYEGHPYNYPVDIWAIGCVLYELLTLKHPFNGNSQALLARNVVGGNFVHVSNCTKGYSSECSELVDSLLKKNSLERPTATQILTMPFVKKHLINFFHDILTRSDKKIGEGTQKIKNALEYAAQNRGMNVEKKISLVNKNYKIYIKQLEELGIIDDILNSVFEKKEKDINEYISDKKQKLDIQEQKKEVIEDALSKLKIEKQNRLKRIEDRKKSNIPKPPSKIIKPSPVIVQHDKDNNPSYTNEINEIIKYNIVENKKAQDKVKDQFKSNNIVNVLQNIPPPPAINDDDGEEWTESVEDEDDNIDEFNEKEKELKEELNYTCQNMKELIDCINAVERKNKIPRSKLYYINS